MVAVRYAGRLRWADVDPRRHALDPREIEAVVKPVIEAAAQRWGDRSRSREVSRATDDRAHVLEAEVQRALVTRWGAWAGGFCWSSPGDGGPVATWCCAAHSLVLDDAASTRASIVRVVESVRAWRRFLEDADAELTLLDAQHGALDVSRATERAAAALAPWVAGLTGATETWHDTLEERSHRGALRRGCEATPGAARRRSLRRSTSGGE